MTKKRTRPAGGVASPAPASPSQRAQHPEDRKDGSDELLDELDSILPDFALALRSTIAPSSYIPSTALQFFSVAYCIFLLPGRPSSLLDPNALLENLIADAPFTLGQTVIGLLVVQLYFGGQAKRWWDTANGKKRVKKSDDGQKTPKMKAQEANQALKEKIDPLIETVMSLVLFSACIFCAAILIGAPVARKVQETATLSAFLAILAFTPSLSALTSPVSAPPVPASKAMVRYTWIRLFSSFEPKSDIEIALLLPAYGTILGCLVGAIPEGLDWEMPWQTWPIPCMLGSFAGWSIGQLASLAIISLMWLSRGKGSRRVLQMQRLANAEASDVAAVDTAKTD